MKLSLLTTALTAILFTASCLHSPAQVLHATRTHYSTENGLSSNSIADIVQDDLGYVWLATWNGLSRFDGYTFYNYKTGAGSHIPNLHNRIRSLLADMQQNIWLRMYDGRIFVMKRSIDRIINPLEGINGYEDFRTDIPLSIASNGDVLASIDGQGIYCFRITPQGIEPQLFTTSGLVITCMAEGYKGDIWLGTDQGIHLLDPSNMTVKREGPFQDEVITSMFSDHYNIYAGTESGKVVTFAYGAEPRVIYEGSRPVNGIFVDSHKLIWFTDDRQGALRINPSTGDVKYFVQELTMPDYDALGGFFNETKEEGADTTYSTLWVRMNHGGYGYYNRQTDEIEYFHNDPTNPWNLCNTVNASLELDEGVIFESTARRGLEKLEIVKNTIQRKLMVPEASSTLENEIRAIYYDEQRHRLLIGNKSHTLNFYNDNFEVVSTISHDDQGNPIGRCYGISKDTKGNYWLSSKDNGLFCITPQGNDTYSVKNICHDDQDINSLSSNATYATVEDRQGNIWVATYGGGANVLAKDKNGHTVFFHPKNGMVGYPYRSHLKVRTIEADRDGNVWAGTTDGILIMSYANGSVNVKKLEESQEYPDSILMSNDIVCLARDSKGMMWIGTNGGGLACTTGKDSKGRWLFRNYGSKDGLPCEEIKSITFDAKGNVWFATDNVICSFDTEKQIFSTFSSLDGVDDTMCSEGAATSMGSDIVLIGTINGYYVIDRKKLANTNASLLKLRITDFWVNDELQSPRLNDYYDFYVPESHSITLPSHNTSIALRFASLNYQLQHRVHYQYMLEGYDRQWLNADKTRTASYSGLPAGTYQFKVKAFLLESPEWADVKKITIIVPPHFLLSTNAIWLYMLIAAVLGLLFLFWRQKKARMRYAPEAETEEDNIVKHFFERLLHHKHKEQTPEGGASDYYEILE
jgi:ligand-binding sensor domain-containing protein